VTADERQQPGRRIDLCLGRREPVGVGGGGLIPHLLQREAKVEVREG
jgi:hypothetical protein